MEAHLGAQCVRLERTPASKPFFSATIGNKFLDFSKYVAKTPYIGEAVDTLLVDIPGYISIAVLGLAEAITRMAIGIITGPLVGIYQHFCNRDPRASINFYYQRNFSLFSNQSVVVKLGYGLIFPAVLLRLASRIIRCVKHYLSCCKSSPKATSEAARAARAHLAQTGAGYAAVPPYTAAPYQAAGYATPPPAPGSSQDNPVFQHIPLLEFTGWKATLLSTTVDALKASGEDYTPFVVYDSSINQWLRFSFLIP